MYLQSLRDGLTPDLTASLFPYGGIFIGEWNVIVTKSSYCRLREKMSFSPKDWIRFCLNWKAHFRHHENNGLYKKCKVTVVMENPVCARPLTFRSRWTTLFWWRKETPSRICLMSLFTSSSLKASSSLSDTHWLKISPPAALHTHTHGRTKGHTSDYSANMFKYVPFEILQCKNIVDQSGLPKSITSAWPVQGQGGRSLSQHALGER